jgi:hypothetical protein
MARIRDVVVDCAHPASLARFWAAVLDDYAVARYDAAELDRLHALGIDDVEDDPAVLVESADAAPRLFFQRVPEAKRVKNRVHLDLRCEDLEPEIERLTALGARVLDRHTDEDWVVLADPEGNEFCVCAQAGSIRSQALP